MPLDPKLNKFSTASPVIASVSFSEIASGEGIVSFLGYTTADNVTDPGYHLSANAFKSASTSTGKVKNNSTETFTYNFDTPEFNISRDLAGTTAIGFSFSVTNGNVGTATSYIIFTIQHYDGTTYTDLGTKQSVTITESSASATQYRDTILNIDMTAQHFAVGDSIRIKVEHYCSSAGISNKTFVFYHDPENSVVGSSTGTEFKINIPFATDDI